MNGETGLEHSGLTSLKEIKMRPKLDILNEPEYQKWFDEQSSFGKYDHGCVST